MGAKAPYPGMLKRALTDNDDITNQSPRVIIIKKRTSSMDSIVYSHFHSWLYLSLLKFLIL